MALQLTRDAPIGVSVPSAYLRVEQPSHPAKDRLAFQLRSYVSQPAAEGGTPFFLDEGFTCPFDMAGGNDWAQAYAFVKTAPGFADATNV